VTASAGNRRVLVVAILASFVAFLDGSVVNLALPAMARDLHGGLALQQWIVDSYLLTLGALILLAGSISDAFGRVPVLRGGLLAFGAGSVAMTFSPRARYKAAQLAPMTPVPTIAMFLICFGM